MSFTYKWKLSDLSNVEKNGLNVFSCFACGGGSTMGYKMGGYNVLGCNEIDPEMAWHYKKNHNPKYCFVEPIQTFKLRDDLPEELYNLDILDGSPPCSSFSMAGNREKNWGDNKKFREGQARQVLDDLFFHFIDLAYKLKPKVVIAENVKGMLQGHAKAYCKEVVRQFKEAGYVTQIFLLNGATMGLPQRRERVFFVAQRVSFFETKIDLRFNEKQISVKEAFDSVADINYKGKDQSSSINHKYYKLCKPGEAFSKYHPKSSLFNWCKIEKFKPSRTIPAHYELLYHYDSMRSLSIPELSMLSSFPLDYVYSKKKLAGYMMGMSVPPIMMYKISKQVYIKLFKNRNDETVV